MPKKKKRYADDGWAVWIDGDDTSTVYLNDWLNPKGKSYVDLAIRVRGVKVSGALRVYVPFTVTRDEIDDISLKFHDRDILQATFSASCIVDYMKNEHTSEIAYNGKTIDIIHISTFDLEIKDISAGSLILIDLEQIKEFIDNDEVYIIWRMPHKSIDEIFRPGVEVGKSFERLRDLVTSPVVFEKYGYSIRINESRLLPEEITRIGAFHRQKLKKAVVAISLDESYEINDSSCYRIRRLEDRLYSNYLPADYKYDDVITYQWNQTRNDNLQGHFNFYYNIIRNHVSHKSMLVYMILLLALAVIGDILSEVIKALLGIF